MVELDDLNADALYQQLKARERKQWKQANKSFNSEEWQIKCSELFQLALKEIENNPKLNIDKY